MTIRPLFHQPRAPHLPNLARNQLPREPRPIVRRDRSRAVIARINRPAPPTDVPVFNKESDATTVRAALDAGTDLRIQPVDRPRASYNSALSSPQARKTSRLPDRARTTAEYSFAHRRLPPQLHPILRAETMTMAMLRPPPIARPIPRIPHRSGTLKTPSRSPRCRHPHPRRLLTHLPPPPRRLRQSTSRASMASPSIKMTAAT